jgi:uncharacterized membrane protein (UPF0182 family)
MRSGLDIRRVGRTLSLVLLVAWLLRFGAALLTERWWFHSLNYPATFSRLLNISVGLWVFSTGVSALALWSVLSRGLNPLITRQDPLVRWLKPIRVATVAFGALVIGPALGGKWQEFSLALYGWDEQVTGPVMMGQGPGFFLFRLPILYATTQWIALLLGTCLVVLLVSSVASGQIVRTAEGFIVGSVALVRQLMVLFGLSALAVAALTWLHRFVLITGNSGLTAKNESLVDPALLVLSLAAVLVALTGLSYLVPGRLPLRPVPTNEPTGELSFRNLLSVPIVGTVVWVVVAGLLVGIVPAVVDSTAPPSLISKRVESLRHGYGVAQLAVMPMAKSDAMPSFELDSGGAGASRPIANPAALFDDSEGGRTVVIPRKSVTQGITGLAAGSTVRRLILSAHISDRSKIVSASSDDLVIWRRTIQERATALAPFLAFGSQPYPVLSANRIVWVLDAYTVGRFPGSVKLGDGPTGLPVGAELTQDFNYVRSEVRVLMDSATGRLVFVRTGSEPLTKVWNRVFPGLFTSVTDADRLFPGVVAQLRYPADIFALQMLATVEAQADQGVELRPAQFFEPNPPESTQANAGEIAATPRTVNRAENTTDAGRLVRVQTLERAANGSWLIEAQLVGRTSLLGASRLELEMFLGRPVPDAASITQRLALQLTELDGRKSVAASASPLEFGSLQVLRWNGEPLFGLPAYRSKELVGIAVSDGRVVAAGVTLQEAWGLFTDAATKNQVVESKDADGALNDPRTALLEARDALRDAELQLRSAQELVESLLEPADRTK